jgi:hypothetical protein
MAKVIKNTDKITNFNPNSYPPNFNDVNIEFKDLPDFAKAILTDISIEQKEKEKFATKFLLNYLNDSFFLKKVEGWFFLFIERKYIGIYEDRNSAFQEVKNIGYQDNQIYLVPTVFDVKGEYTETSSVDEN